MTDHLEPYRRMVRSMRFSPPLSLTQLSQKSAAHLVTTEPVDSWSKTTLPDTHVQSVSESPIDLSEHTAALIHKAVRKPTVLPTTYVILENIGDRISRLTTPKPVTPVTIPFKIPQADANTTAIQTSKPEPVQADSSESIDDTPVVAVAQPVEVEDTPSPKADETASTVITEPVEAEETSDENTVAVVAQPVEVEDTSANEAAVVTEPVAEEEILDNNPVVTKSVEVEETPSDASDNSLSDVIDESSVLTETASEVETPAVETEDTQQPTFLDRVSSVVEAVSNAFKKPDTEQNDSDAVGELAPTDSVTSETDTTEALTTAVPAPADEAEETSAPTLVERVSSAVEAVVTTLKDIGVDHKNSETGIEPTLAKDDNTLDSQISEITCPKCQSTDIRKNGRRQDKQRYFCKDCGRQFVISSLAKEEDNPELDKSASVETSNLEGSQANKGVTNSHSKSSKPSSKKKAKAKGFGNSKAK
ncbi:hypothetical protein H6F98_28570 [Microcoleus sp. FACHB-SPT15]|uniref:IS1/IS1595 family N-terminal zinc-binding domain-containing protein n=1 Tax=Microcoleus sp. FACHB-SPT15 TaxID=2692830 RepID=UPI0017823C82|nr:hypothetical protein [Microcoleus sp. FACHB-SPT15]